MSIHTELSVLRDVMLKGTNSSIDPFFFLISPLFFSFFFSPYNFRYCWFASSCGQWIEFTGVSELSLMVLVDQGELHKDR